MRMQKRKCLLDVEDIVAVFRPVFREDVQALRARQLSTEVGSAWSIHRRRTVKDEGGSLTVQDMTGTGCILL